MVDKFNGGNSKNARIKIDYSGIKPKVNFSYPDKKNQYSGDMFSPVIFGSMLIIILIYLTYSLIYGQITYSNYSQTKLESFSKCAIENQGLMKDNYSYIRNNLCKDKIDTNIEMFSNVFNFKSSILFILIFIFPFINYFVFKKRWDSLYPKYQALISTKKFKKFLPKDIKRDNDNNLYCEIPIFNNIILDYKATEDFSKYLKFFEIREFNFKHYKYSKIKNSKRKKRKLNEYIWYAKFYFKQKPINGKLEVIFK
ncbi:MAG TPA: hypothetical protein ENI61_06250 [Ignavibacteria bacterium]|nr:hypothetical protein [Ignavibacteria bacterium]